MLPVINSQQLRRAVAKFVAPDTVEVNISSNILKNISHASADEFLIYFPNISARTRRTSAVLRQNSSHLSSVASPQTASSEILEYDRTAM